MSKFDASSDLPLSEAREKKFFTFDFLWTYPFI